MIHVMFLDTQRNWFPNNLGIVKNNYYMPKLLESYGITMVEEFCLKNTNIHIQYNLRRKFLPTHGTWRTNGGKGTCHGINLASQEDIITIGFCHIGF